MSTTLKKGDLVQVISGRDLGKQGRVENVLPSEGKVVITGINIRKHHFKPSKTRPKGGIVEFPAPLTRSNVMVVCPHCSKMTRIRTTTTETTKYRSCLHCNDSLDTK